MSTSPPEKGPEVPTLRRRKWAKTKAANEGGQLGRIFSDHWIRCSQGRSILRAIKQVVSNKGAPGIDGATVDQYEAPTIRSALAGIAEHIRGGSYIPAPVRRVDIPQAERRNECSRHSDGAGPRDTARAIARILVGHFTLLRPDFGFRPGRSALEAIDNGLCLGTSRRKRTGWWGGWTWKSSSAAVNHDPLSMRA